MAGDVLPALDAGPHFAVGLLSGVFIHSIRSSIISSTVLPRLVCRALWSRKVSATRLAPVPLQAVDPVAGVLDGEVSGL